MSEDECEAPVCGLDLPVSFAVIASLETVGFASCVTTFGVTVAAGFASVVVGTLVAGFMSAAVDADD